MARLDYDIDNFSGRYNRGTRYQIIADGYVMYDDVCEEEVDKVASRLEKSGIYKNVEIKEK